MANGNAPNHPPSGPIQVQARGLLGFLQLKNSGRNPSDLSDLLQPVLEMRDWLFETNSESVISPLNGAAFIPNGTATGNYPVITVPNSEAWALLDFSVTPVTGAGQAITFRLHYLDMPAPQGAAFGLSEYLVKAASSAQQLAMPRSYRIPILPPGSQLAIEILSVTYNAANIPGSAVARIARLRS